MRTASITVFLLLAALLPAAAQVTTSSMSGRVMDGGDPVEGVTVLAINTQSGYQYPVETDEGGYWHILDIPAGGPYTVRFVSFGSPAVTVRGAATYVSQNLVIDVDLSDGSSYVRTDSASTVTTFSSSSHSGTTMFIGQPLSAKAEMVSEGSSYTTYGFWPEPLNQISFTQMPYDVRLDGDLLSATTSYVARYGTDELHAVAYDYYTDASMNNAGIRNMTGVSLSGPLLSDDLLAYSTFQYTDSQWSSYTRLDWRAGENTYLDGVFTATPDFTLANGELTSSLSGGRASNNVNATWYRNAAGMTYGFLTDSYTLTHRASRYTFGTQICHTSCPDTVGALKADFYVQDDITIARRFHLTAGLKMGCPFTFSPRLSFRYDLLGNNSIVLRGGTAVYDSHDAPSTWKLSFAVEKSLPLKFRATVDWLYGQYWNRLFYISSRNILDNYYYLTGRLERPLGSGLSAVASYSLSNKFTRDRVVAGLTYTWNYSSHAATGAALSYRGCTPFGDDGTVGPWQNILEWRLSQLFHLDVLGVRHTLNLTFYESLAAERNINMLILRYSF